MKTTTTERPRARRARPDAPAHPGGARDLRLYLTALLAMIYLLAWWAFGARQPRSAATPEPAPPALTPAAPSQLAIWYADLPPARRPVVRVPAGWQIAPTTPAATSTLHDAPPRPVRVAPARARRVRTRSS
jgi:hypothetical protein